MIISKNKNAAAISISISITETTVFVWSELNVKTPNFQHGVHVLLGQWTNKEDLLADIFVTILFIFSFFWWVVVVPKEHEYC